MRKKTFLQHMKKDEQQQSLKPATSPLYQHHGAMAGVSSFLPQTGGNTIQHSGGLVGKARLYCSLRAIFSVYNHTLI